MSVSKSKSVGAIFPTLLPLSIPLFVNNVLILTLKFSTSFVFSLAPNSIMNVALPFVATLIADYPRLESLMN